MIRILIFSAIGFFIVFHSLNGYLSLPVVEFSWSTKECVSVSIDAFTCDNLPEKYESIWVE